MDNQRTYIQVYTKIIGHNFLRVMITFEVCKNLHKVPDFKKNVSFQNMNYVATIEDVIRIGEWKVDKFIFGSNLSA